MVLHKLMLSAITTVTLYGSIRFFGHLDLLVYIWLPGLGVAAAAFPFIAYPIAGRLSVSSQNFREMYTRKVQFSKVLGRKEKKKFEYYLKVCRDLRITFGGFYHYQKWTIFSFFDIIVNGAITLLLTLP
jgi:hypothetical protein